MSDNQEKFYCCREQEGMDDWVAVRAGARATTRIQKVRVSMAVRRATDIAEEARTEQARAQQEKAAVRVQQIGTQQSEDRLDREIELMRKLMVKVSQWKETTRNQRNNRSKGKRVTDCESLTSGKMQHKIWKPGEVKKKSIVADGQLENKVWDPGRQG